MSSVIGSVTVPCYTALNELPTDGSELMAVVEFATPTAVPGLPAADRVFMFYVGNDVFYGTGVPLGWRPLA